MLVAQRGKHAIPSLRQSGSEDADKDAPEKAVFSVPGPPKTGGFREERQEVRGLLNGCQFLFFSVYMCISWFSAVFCWFNLTDFDINRV